MAELLAENFGVIVTGLVAVLVAYIGYVQSRQGKTQKEIGQQLNNRPEGSPFLGHQIDKIAATTDALVDHIQALRTSSAVSNQRLADLEHRISGIDMVMMTSNKKEHK